jgi:hypothetical protein
VSRPSRWGNPFVVGDEVEIRLSGIMRGRTAGGYDAKDPRGYDCGVVTRLSAEQAVWLYRMELLGTLADPDPFFDDLRIAFAGLRGHDLCCWCPLDRPCHADVVLEIANSQWEVAA